MAGLIRKYVGYLAFTCATVVLAAVVKSSRDKVRTNLTNKERMIDRASRSLQ